MTLYRECKEEVVEVTWERWARERLEYLESLIARGCAIADQISEADGLRAGLAAAP